MIRIGENLYQTMQADMTIWRQKGMEPGEETECFFGICTNYWTLLQKQVATYQFSNVKDEIFFFKKLKPLFTSEIEFYGLKHYAQLFKNSTTDYIELMAFLKREYGRLVKFRNEYEDFYHYYKGESIYNDKKWFVRANNDLSNMRAEDLAEVDMRSTTSHDWMVARILALEKYQDYVHVEMGLLEESSKPHPLPPSP
jgi:hypothetical protein